MVCSYLLETLVPYVFALLNGFLLDQLTVCDLYIGVCQ